MQFPEHTMESYLAAAEMGAEIVECEQRPVDISD
jgi:glycerophosphoryl diester phosphodiesterase